MDGLTPVFLSDREKTLDKSRNLWEKHSQQGNESDLREEILRNYGARYYHQEIVSLNMGLIDLDECFLGE
jgi:hypothetical protein